ncbi:MAG: response regulator [Pseudomonadales bacterium]|nr:response regulator [Pseudomonadales bacterium]
MSELSIYLRFATVAILAVLLPLAVVLLAIEWVELPAVLADARHYGIRTLLGFGVSAGCILVWMLLRLRQLLRSLKESLPVGEQARRLRRLWIDGALSIAFYAFAGPVSLTWDVGMFSAQTPPEVWIILSLLPPILFVYMSVPLFLYTQNLLGREIGAQLSGYAGVPVWLHSFLVGVGITFLSTTSFVLYEFAILGSIHLAMAFVSVVLLIFAAVVSLLAYRGQQQAIAPLSHFLNPAAAGAHGPTLAELQPRSLDVIGRAIGRLRELFEENERLAREERVQAHRNRLFAATATDYFFSLDKDLRFDFVSDRLEAISGYPVASFIGVSGFSLDVGADPEREEELHARLRAHAPFRKYQFSIQDAAGRTRYLEVSGTPNFDDTGVFQGYLGAGSDVTEVVEAEISLRDRDKVLAQAQKMEAVGQLTGGIAHDFNNLLTAVIGNLELLQLRVGGDLEAQRHAGAALRAAIRGAALTQRLLAFSRRQALAPEAVDVRALIEGMMELMVRTLGAQIEIRISGEEKLWAAHVDPHQLESALLNLAINARDAMPRGGALEFRLTNVVGGRSSGEDCVVIEVCDEGVGIDADALPHVFEPFFTTKKQGEGSGLGLSVVYGFVQQSGGEVSIFSRSNEGTRVELRLPRSGESSSSRTGVGATNDERTTGAHIMVIEDDPAVRMVMIDALSSGGHRVTVVDTADAAVGHEAVDDLDLVISDIILPGQRTGLDAAAELIERKPGLKVLLMTGYADEVLRRQGRDIGEIPLLHKPFTLAELHSRVAGLLRG